MKKTVCVCDRCSKESSNINFNFGMPNGWLFVENIQKDGVTKIRDKHFCSKECLIEFLELVM